MYKRQILTGRGAYIWNQDIPVSLDIETFEKSIKQAGKHKDPVCRIGLYNEAVTLYKGEFLPKFTSEYWVASQAAYYHTTYLGAVKSLAILLESEGRYSEIDVYKRQLLQRRICACGDMRKPPKSFGGFLVESG